MAQYRCLICGYIYDEAAGYPEANIAPGTKWEDIPEDFVCPICGASKDQFEKIQPVKSAEVLASAFFCIHKLYNKKQVDFIKRKLSYASLYVFIALGILFGGYIFTQGNTAKALLGFATLFFLAVPAIAKSFLRAEPYLLYMLSFAFCILAYDFGCVLELFDAVPYLDKISHFLSGPVFTIIGICLYLLITNTNSVPQLKNTALVSTCFGVFFASFIAVIWEVCEFLGFVLTGNDSQHHLTTGVFDTMGDLIACLVGSLFCAGALLLYYKKGIRLIAASVIEEFTGCLPVQTKEPALAPQVSA